MVTEPTAHRGRRAVVTILLWLLALIACWGFAWTVAPDVNASGQCEGIGFGCTLTPRDTVLFVGFFATPVLVGTLVVGLSLVAVAVRQRWMPRAGGAALGTLSVLGGLVATLGLAALLLFLVGI